MSLFKKQIFLSLGIFIIIVMSAFQGCAIKNPIEGVTTRISNIPRTTSARVVFTDQNDGKIIKKSRINVTFTGIDANNVITTNNEPMTSTIVDSMLVFAIADNIVPSVNKPVELILVAKADNYLSTSQRIVISSPGANDYVIPMVSHTTTVPGITSQSVPNIGTTSAATGTTAPIVASSTSSSTIAGAEITIPAGTILKDKDGVVLSGTVAARITYFDATQPTSVASLPGGFAMRDENNAPGSFITAGFAAIDMTVNGVDVKSFGSPVNVNLGINLNTINPETGVAVKAGDQIPLWSYDKETGTWKNEGVQTITGADKPGNSLSVTKKDVTHLSWWNLDWHYTGACATSGTKIAFSTGGWQSLFVGLYFVKGNQLWTAGTVNSFDPTLQFFNAPNLPMKLKAFLSYSDYYLYYPGGEDRSVGNMTINNLCQVQTVTMPITIPESMALTSVNITVRGICSNGNILAEGNLDLYMFDYNNGWWKLAGRIVNGNIKIDGLRLNNKYTFSTYYNNEWFYREEMITSKTQSIDINLPPNCPVCK